MSASSRAFAAALGLGLGLWAASALGHVKGIHKRTSLEVSAGRIELLLAVDYDGGPRTQLLRQGVDADGDGRLGQEEARRLEERLASQALKGLSVRVSGARLEVRRSGVKLSLRGDFSAGSAEGLSVAVLAFAELPSAAEGMSLEVQDASPDRSHVRVEVVQHLRGDGGVVQEARELERGEVLRVRLGSLKVP